MFSSAKSLFNLQRPFIRQVSKYHWLNVSDEVKTALIEKRGVVVLESTVITHGMPYPQNLNIAQELERLVREQNCVPATVALFDGTVHVGLNEKQLNVLSTCKTAQKVSRRDLAAVLAKKTIGSTTVSATMIAAHAAGISVFATGGIGGVHRGVTESYDVSADLTELGRTPVTVVCAGVKSILDVPKTLEYLETEGVPVITFGEDNDFPGFFTRKSGCKSPFSFNNEHAIASVINLSLAMKLQNGHLIAVPIPKTEQNAGDKIEAAVKQALMELRKLNISGRDITPFVLKRVNELTEGLSLHLNSILIKNNAIHASKIADALSQLQRQSTSEENLKNRKDAADVVVVGGSIVDFYIQTDEEIHNDGRTIPGRITQVCGGVGRNHADALTRLGLQTLLISAAGNDELKTMLQNNCRHMDLRAVKWIKNCATASYAGITNKGDLSFGIASMDVFNHIDANSVNSFRDDLIRCKLCVIDGNPPFETLSHVCGICSEANIPVWFDPADSSKVKKIFQANCWQKISYFSPNWNEFLMLTSLLGLHFDETLLLNKKLLYDNLTSHAKNLFTGSLKSILLTLSQDGVITICRLGNKCSITHYDCPIVPNIVNVSGTGDCFNSGCIYGLLNGRSLAESITYGLHLAGISLQSEHPVPPQLNNFSNLLNLDKPTIRYSHEFLL